jgi:hypothetical protein
MSSLLQNLIDRYPEAFDHLFFFVRLGLFVYIAVGLFPILRKHVLNWSNSNTNAPRPLNAPSVYNTQQAAQYLRSAQPVANAPQSANAPAVYHTQQAAQYLHSAQAATNAPRPLNTPAADNTQPVALYTHTAQPAANTPQSLNTPRPLNAPNAYNTQQAAHYTSQTQPNSLRLPSPERFVATLIRLYRASIINVRIGHCNVRIGGISGLIFLSFLLLLW